MNKSLISQSELLIPEKIISITTKRRAGCNVQIKKNIFLLRKIEGTYINQVT